MQQSGFGFSTTTQGSDYAANLGYIPLIAIAHFNQNPMVSAGFWGLVASLAFYGWIYNFRRGRAIADIALSNIGSAAQGYVELTGRGSVKAENMVVSPLSGTHCIWFRYWVYEKHDDDWRVVNEGASPYTVQIDDGTGTCQVDLDGAEVMGSSRRVSYDGRYKNVELLLFGGGSLYVLGDFCTIGGANSTLNLKEDVNELLTDWKQDKASLYNRFDLNKDGQIDAREWELARREAIKQVQLQHREIRATSGVNIMRAPQDKKLYLVSTISPQKLRSRLMFWAVFHLMILVVAASFALSNLHKHSLLS